MPVVNIFLSALILLIVNKIDQKKQFIELLCLFCFLGWSLSICILGTYSHFRSWTCKYRAQFRARETWSGLFAFICLFVLQVIQAWKSPQQFGSTLPFVNETPQTQYHKCIMTTHAVSNKISWSSLSYSPNQILNDLLFTIVTLPE